MFLAVSLMVVGCGLLSRFGEGGGAALCTRLKLGAKSSAKKVGKTFTLKRSFRYGIRLGRGFEGVLHALRDRKIGLRRGGIKSMGTIP